MAGGQRGGAEAFFDRLLPAFAASGLEQRALVRPSPERCQSLKAAGIDVVPLRFGGPLVPPNSRRDGISNCESVKSPHAPVALTMTHGSICLTTASVSAWFKKGSGTVAGTAGHRPKVGRVLRTKGT